MPPTGHNQRMCLRAIDIQRPAHAYNRQPVPPLAPLRETVSPWKGATKNIRRQVVERGLSNIRKVRSLGRIAYHTVIFRRRQRNAANHARRTNPRSSSSGSCHPRPQSAHVFTCQRHSTTSARVQPAPPLFHFARQFRPHHRQSLSCPLWGKVATFTWSKGGCSTAVVRSGHWVG